MKQQRDLDLIRLILLEVEGIEDIDLSEYEAEKVDYHKYLLIDAGFVKGDCRFGYGEFGEPVMLSASADIITWKGQEFLANAKNESVWKEAKKTVAEKGASVSLTILTALLQKITMEGLGL